MYKIQAPILVAGSHVTISFDVVESNIPFEKTMKNWHLVINVSDDTAEFTINGERKHEELFTSKSGCWCIDIQPNLSKEENVSVVECLHRHFCHPPYQFLKKVLMNFGEVDKQLLEVVEKYCNDCIVCKRYKPAIYPSHLLETCLILRK